MPEKLVRDLIPTIHEGEYSVRRASSEELLAFKLAKVEEEAEELRKAASTRGAWKEVVHEAADVIEAVLAVAAQFGYTPNDIQHERELKLIKKGGFTMGFISDVP